LVVRFLQSIDRDAISDLLKRDEYFWLDLSDPGEAEAAGLAEVFSFHPLVVEDVLKRGQRPKLEDFGEYMFLVYYAAAGGEGAARVELEEIHAFLSGGYIVTSHTGRCAALEDVRRHLEAQSPRSEQFVVYRVLDALTDTFFPVLEAFDERLERLDEEIFDRTDPTQLKEITALRRELVALRRVVTPQRDMLARSIDDILEIPGLEADSREYFRDVYDHAIRISDQIDSYRDLLAGSRDAYLSVTSNRLNEITKQLTVVATVFVPLSFLVGFFGQNFKWLVTNIDTAAAFWGLGVGGALVSLVALLIWFRRGSIAIEK
jgi:magnesium transporter